MTKLADLEAAHARVLALFEGPLAGVRFPDVDADILNAHVRDAKKAAVRVETLRAELDDARRVLDEEEDRLAGRVERALAYLRVYAEGNVPLLGEVEAVSERLRPQAVVAAMPTTRRRGRPPKASGMLALQAAAPARESTSSQADTSHVVSVHAS